MYLSPESVAVRRRVRFLRQVWRGAEEQLYSVLKQIIDPAALAVVIISESKAVAEQVRLT